MIGGKLCRFVSLYRLPNQSQDDFQSFANIDAVTAINLFLTVVLGDFTIKSNLWFKGDKTSYEGSKIDATTSQFGLQQLINEPTHLAADSSSCIDSIFTSAKFSDGIRGALTIIFKLSSSDSLCKI